MSLGALWGAALPCRVMFTMLRSSSHPSSAFTPWLSRFFELVVFRMLVPQASTRTLHLEPYWGVERKILHHLRLGTIRRQDLHNPSALLSKSYNSRKVKIGPKSGPMYSQNNPYIAQGSLNFETAPCASINIARGGWSTIRKVGGNFGVKAPALLLL